MSTEHSNISLFDRDKLLSCALNKYHKTPNDLDGYVTITENWLKSQKHLPEVPHRNVIINFLFMNKFSIQNAKEKIEMYYSIRTILPEFFKNKNPSSTHMQECADKIYFVPLPKATEEGYRVSVMKAVDKNPENFQVYDFFAHTYNVTEVRLHEDVAVGDIFIYDCSNLTIGHFLKMTPVVMRKTTVILEKVYSNRVKQIHLLNTPKYAAATISIAKQVMKPKIASRIHVHKNSNSISEYISLNILPSDYGGKERTMTELNELWKTKLAEYKERFDALEKMRIKEELKPMPLINDEILGFHGNFRKLNLD